MSNPLNHPEEWDATVIDGQPTTIVNLHGLARMVREHPDGPHAALALLYPHLSPSVHARLREVVTNTR